VKGEAEEKNPTWALIGAAGLLSPNQAEREVDGKGGPKKEFLLMLAPWGCPEGTWHWWRKRKKRRWRLSYVPKGFIPLNCL